MFDIFFLPIVLLACVLHLTHAQRMVDYPIPPINRNVSSSCLAALRRTVSCPAFLAERALDNPRLFPHELNELCTEACRQSLLDTRTAIQQNCTATSERTEFEGVVYPATFVVDRFLYTYSLACRKSTTNTWCDDVLGRWHNDSSRAPSAHNKDCGHCLLSAAQVQLNSPFGYDHAFAEQFRLQTSSCRNTRYPFTSPAPYTLGTVATSTAPAQPTSTCVSHYAVAPGDTCNSIAKTNRVSTYHLLLANSLSLECEENPAQSTQLCIPSQCSIHTVQRNDTCAGIVEAFTATGAQLIAWNPNINEYCGNLDTMIGAEICVSPPGGPIANPQPSSALAPSSATTAAPQPTNAAPSSNARCGKWYEVVSGDTCDIVSIRHELSLRDFYFLNPHIDSECTNLWLATSYCVQAVGSITTYSGYPTTTNFITLSSTSFQTATATPTEPFTVPTREPELLLPRASGTIEGCVKYQNYVKLEPGSREDLVKAETRMNSCSFVADFSGTTIDKLRSWNPSLSESDCRLQPGFSYCVLRSEDDYIEDRYREARCSLGNDDPVPGTTNACTCFATVSGLDRFDAICEDIAAMYRVSVADLINWNSWLADDCDTDLFAGMEDADQRPVCIEVNGEVGLTSQQLSANSANRNTEETAGESTPSSSTATRTLESFDGGTAATTGTSEPTAPASRSATVSSVETSST
ncbi:hypothetical protein CKM354_000768300 [Cercospora kikuchii]|uniref:LysM domain-containing protein n=1 Tax=Cercospora kikuchii TaxID=84275 RepID=A0A9P3CKP1_9PEZI|nr:uncharacterized protein CKM354_000768300 [Cercospora kikuchii]GIZ44486.1 hypothetical protein CKM354_000768300 [Cercospora kikuchii]